MGIGWLQTDRKPCEWRTAGRVTMAAHAHQRLGENGARSLTAVDDERHEYDVGVEAELGVFTAGS
jgi:hypothetical protein